MPGQHACELGRRPGHAAGGMPLTATRNQGLLVGIAASAPASGAATWTVHLPPGGSTTRPRLRAATSAQEYIIPHRWVPTPTKRCQWQHSTCSSSLNGHLNAASCHLSLLLGCSWQCEANGLLALAARLTPRPTPRLTPRSLIELLAAETKENCARLELKRRGQKPPLGSLAHNGPATD